MAESDGLLSAAFETRIVNGFPVIVRKGEDWAAKPSAPKPTTAENPSPFKGHPVVDMMRERLSAATQAVASAPASDGSAEAAGGGGKKSGADPASGAGADSSPAGAAAGGGGGSKSKSKGKGGVLNGPGQVAADPSRVWVPSKLPLEERISLAMSCGEEVTTEADLRALFKAKDMPVCYDGFEPSGRMHIAQGVLKSIIVNKLTDAGCRFRFWVADWFALLNNKMGGDLAKIQTVGRYFVEVWRAVGMNMDNVEFLWASEEINKQPDQYWMRVMDIARHSTLKRVQRCCTIMGRAESESMPAAQILYPCMQCADIFYLGADICQLGMDQRKVNMLAREYVPSATDKKRLRFPPVVVSHHMLMGLKEGQGKMSKSDPDSAIFMEDSEADVKRKIKRAFCPPEQVAENPCLDWMKHIIFPKFGECSIQRESEDEPHRYTDYEELEADYAGARLHPSRLKPVLTELINVCLEPVRKHFASGEPKKLLALVKKYRVTR